MSLTLVQARILQIQSQLAQLTPAAAPAASPADGTAFAQALDSATAATGAPGATGATGATSATGGSSLENAIVKEAKQFLGLPYVWGGVSKTKGVDCSGLLKLVYGKFGINLPRVSADQARAGQKVNSMAEARPGDLVGWNNSSRNNGADHIAIYIGGGKMIEAARPGTNVRLVDVPSTPDYIRRVLPTNAPTGVASAPPAGGAGQVAGRGQVAGVPYADIFNRIGAQYGVSPSLLSAVAKQESGYNPKAVSGVGAQGLMQLMPGTARGLGVRNSFDPAQAVDGAARMLRDLINRFGRVDYALAGYNAGPGAVLKYKGIPPYAETRNYVKNVMSLAGLAA